MKATINVLSGAVRIFSGDNTTAKNTEPSHAPLSVELDGGWAIGSATTPGDVMPGSFSVEAQEDGELRWFKVAHDVYGNVSQSTDSEMVTLKTGEVRTFNAHDSNAYTISSEGPEQPERPE
jgi:hypothetical protein